MILTLTASLAMFRAMCPLLAQATTIPTPPREHVRGIPCSLPHMCRRPFYCDKVTCFESKDVRRA